MSLMTDLGNLIKDQVLPKYDIIETTVGDIDILDGSVCSVDSTGRAVLFRSELDLTTVVQTASNGHSIKFDPFDKNRFVVYSIGDGFGKSYVNVGRVHNGKIYLKDSVIFTSASTYTNGTSFTCEFDPNEKGVIIFTTLNHATVGIIDSADNITFGTEARFTTDSVSNETDFVFLDDDPNKILLFYSHNADNTPYYVIGTRNGNAITFGSPVQITTTSISKLSPVAIPGTSNVFLSYSSTSYTIYARMLNYDNSTDTVTLNSSATLDTGATNGQIVSTIDPFINSRVITIYTPSTNGDLVVCNTSSTTVSPYTPILTGVNGTSPEIVGTSQQNVFAVASVGKIFLLNLTSTTTAETLDTEFTILSDTKDITINADDYILICGFGSSTVEMFHIEGSSIETDFLMTAVGIADNVGSRTDLDEYCTLIPMGNVFSDGSTFVPGQNYYLRNTSVDIYMFQDLLINRLNTDRRGYYIGKGISTSEILLRGVE